MNVWIAMDWTQGDYDCRINGVYLTLEEAMACAETIYFDSVNGTTDQGMPVRWDRTATGVDADASGNAALFGSEQWELKHWELNDRLEAGGHWHSTEHDIQKVEVGVPVRLPSREMSVKQ